MEQQCGESSSNKDGLAQKQPKQEKCAECKKSYKNKTELRQHNRRRHTQLQPHPCYICGKIYYGKVNFERHQSTHSDVRSFECFFCKKMYKCKASVQSHIHQHLKLLPFVCSICGKRYICGQALSRHVARAHNETRSFPCCSCDKAFKTEFDLKMHSRYHYKFKRFACAYCGRRFVRKQELDGHRRTHTDERLFECFFCRQKFKYKKTLKVHIYGRHLRILPHVCSTCGKCFHTPSKLKDHGKCDIRHRPFQCHHCGSSFTARGSLKKHSLRFHPDLEASPLNLVSRQPRIRKQLLSYAEISMSDGDE